MRPTKEISTRADIFSDAEVVSRYSIEQAVEDGLLVETKILNKIKGIDSPKAPFSHITNNLLFKHGYMAENYDVFCGHTRLNLLTGKYYRCKIRDCPECNAEKGEVIVNYPNILDLLNQALQILKRHPRGDHHYQGEIELPSGMKQMIYIELNEIGRFTIMLPEDR
jgi:hypothetical protein